MACAALAASSPAFSPAAADEILTELKWLSVDADRVEHLTTFVPEPISEDDFGTYEFELGRLAFRSPGLLGGVAAREGLTCQTCHMNGRSNPNFFLAGLSSDPGTVDTTTAVFSEVLGDGTFNPIEIPTLVGITESGPYGHDGREPSLEAFTRTVIVDEFAGREPDPVIFDAVITYISALKDQLQQPRHSFNLQSQFLDLERSLLVLEQAVRKDDREVALFVIFAIRSHFGRIAERLPGQELAQERDYIQQWSGELRSIRDLLDAGDGAGANAELGEWHRKYVSQRIEVVKAAEKSLFNLEKLRAALETTKQN